MHHFHNLKNTRKVRNSFIPSPPGIYFSKFITKRRKLCKHPRLVPASDTQLRRGTKHSQKELAEYSGAEFHIGPHSTKPWGQCSTQECLKWSHHSQYRGWSVMVWKWIYIVNKYLYRNLDTRYFFCPVPATDRNISGLCPTVFWEKTPISLGYLNNVTCRRDFQVKPLYMKCVKMYINTHLPAGEHTGCAPEMGAPPRRRQQAAQRSQGRPAPRRSSGFARRGFTESLSAPLPLSSAYRAREEKESLQTKRTPDQTKGRGGSPSAFL